MFVHVFYHGITITRHIIEGQTPTWLKCRTNAIPPPLHIQISQEIRSVFYPSLHQFLPLPSLSLFASLQIFIIYKFVNCFVLSLMHRCGNVNWARRNECNVCHSPKFGKIEERTGKSLLPLFGVCQYFLSRCFWCAEPTVHYMIHLHPNIEKIAVSWGLNIKIGLDIINYFSKLLLLLF